MSTLHSAVLRGGTEKKVPAFDLRSWQGLTLVLKAGKESLREPGAYAEFRDLVLQYAQQGGDVEIKKKIDAIIVNFPPLTETVPVRDEEGSTEPEPIPEESESPHEAGHGVGRRVQPRFGVRTEKPVPEPMNSVEVHLVSEAPKMKETVSEEVSVSVATEPVSVHISQEIPLAPSEVSEQKEEPSTSYEHKTLDEYKARIAEIKRSVHERVGNPVALMGMKNDIGKNYMAALLSALKATGAGGSPNVDATMHTLERAYTILVATHEDVKQPEPDPVVLPQSAEVIHTDVSELVAPEGERVVEPSPDTVHERSSLSDETNTVDIARAEERVEDEVPTDDIQSDKEEMLRTSFEKSDNVISAVVGAVQRKKYVERESSAPLIVDDTTIVESDGEAKPVQREGLQDISRRPVSPAHEIGFPENKHTVKNVGADPSYANVKQSELFSQEITSYLDTLLNEWSIFSGSGIFGTGPGGLEHPLFITLAPLSMGEVIAGRWDGTNPKTLKIIKEYVDAWRHEQGITYTANETFEHYLRRVVERILKRRAS